MQIVRALLYLRLVSLANLLLRNLRRLRQPKYLLGAAAAAAYFWFFFLRKGPGSGGGAFAKVFAEGRIEWIAAGVLSLFALLIWATPGDQPGLAFTEAETAFLFPAPLTRAQLIHYKLVDGLLMTLFGALFFTLISASVRDAPTALRHLGAWWVLNANISLHQTAAALTVPRLVRLGVDAGLRRLLVIGGGVVLLVVLIIVAVEAGPAALGWLLWPARLAVRPFLADGIGDYLLALGPAAALVAVHYLWIHRLETPFEEASLARAKKLGETIERMRAGKAVAFAGKTRAKRPPFRLGDHLPAEAALLWKNLMAAPGWLNRKVFLAAVALTAIGFTWLQGRTDIAGPKLAGAAGVIALVFLVYVLIFGPQVARNDLRGDLLHADLLKAWPLPGWRIVLGGLLAPTVQLTAIAWVLLLAAALGLVPPPGKTLWLTPELRVTGALCLAVLMPFLCAVQLLVPNAGALLFPAWAQHSRNMTGGIDVMGQRLIFFAGQFLCLLAALLPAAAVGGATIFLTQWLVGPPAAVALATLPVLAVFAGELWLGVRLLGPRFDRLDISSELRP